MKLTENEIAKNIGILKAKPYLDKKKMSTRPHYSNYLSRKQICTYMKLFQRIVYYFRIVYQISIN